MNGPDGDTTNTTDTDEPASVPILWGSCPRLDTPQLGLPLLEDKTWSGDGLRVRQFAAGWRMWREWRVGTPDLSAGQVYVLTRVGVTCRVYAPRDDRKTG